MNFCSIAYLSLRKRRRERDTERREWGRDLDRPLKMLVMADASEMKYAIIIECLDPLKKEQFMVIFPKSVI